jgi:uncharacterized protein YdhG (YjbR/CyaY superfamily)
MNHNIADVEAYISNFPEEIQKLLIQIRTTIRKVVPEAEETIKYAMPTYVYHGNLVHFAAFKNHIGFYSVPSGIEAFKKELSVYKGAKGSVQFPLDQPMPLDLIKRIVEFRVKENQEKSLKKKHLRTCKNGHKYYKSSDCPTCPICEEERKPHNSFLSQLGAPARRALENNEITSLSQLAKLTEKEVLAFHGIGKSTIPKLKALLAEEGLDFQQ